MKGLILKDKLLLKFYIWGFIGMMTIFGIIPLVMNFIPELSEIVGLTSYMILIFPIFLNTIPAELFNRDMMSKFNTFEMTLPVSSFKKSASRQISSSISILIFAIPIIIFLFIYDRLTLLEFNKNIIVILVAIFSVTIILSSLIQIIWCLTKSFVLTNILGIVLGFGILLILNFTVLNNVSNDIFSLLSKAPNFLDTYAVLIGAVFILLALIIGIGTIFICSKLQEKDKVSYDKKFTI